MQRLSKEGAGQQSSAAIGGDPRFEAVHADLARIFAGLPRSRPSFGEGREKLPPFSRPVALWLVVGILLLLLLGSLLAGVRDRGRPVTVAAPPASSRSTASVPPDREPMHTDAPPVSPRVARTVAADRPNRTPLRPAPLSGAATAKPEASLQHRQSRVAVPHASATLRLGQEPEQTEERDHTGQAAAQACPSAYEAWCLRGSTLAADRDLRDAYRAAAQAGVSRKELRKVRKDWVRYRKQANRNPVELIQGYRAATERLRQLASGSVPGEPSQKQR